MEYCVFFLGIYILSVKNISTLRRAAFRNDKKTQKLTLINRLKTRFAKIGGVTLFST